MILHGIFGTLAGLSLALTLWQWLAARQFPLHQRSAPHQSLTSQPAVTLLKPVKGADEFTEACLRSWFAQDYTGEIQILFGVAAPNDPAGAVVKKLIGEFPQRDAELVVCPERLGANAKVSKLAALESRAKHEVIVLSDADVRVPADFLANVVAPLCNGKVGLVNCFYQLANPTTPAMRWEAVAINADFWSQVLQSKSLQPLDFALGAAIATRRTQLAEIGGFRALADCLADDYQLGHRIAQRGHRIELCPVVVECWTPPMGWRAVWQHQLRWARTIRVCQPLPYFFSILSNATLWPLLWLAVQPTILAGIGAGICLLTRSVSGFDLQRRLAAGLKTSNHTAPGPRSLWLVPVKDWLQVAIWMGAFAGNVVEWRGEKYRVRRDGMLVRF